MATKDLIDQLKCVPTTLESTLQQPVRDSILRLLDDKNSDVSTIAVKCLSQLAQKLAAEHITFLVDKLGEFVVDASKSSRDIVTDGLQTMIASMPDEAGAKIAPKLIAGLTTGLTRKQQKDEVDMEMACLTIIKNVRAGAGGWAYGERGRGLSGSAGMGLNFLDHRHSAVVSLSSWSDSAMMSPSNTVPSCLR